MRQGCPLATAGTAVGLLGGSFDPAHDGHVHITQEALRRFGLDRIWWLVSPGNPLKPRPPAPLPQRLVHARRLMRHPRVLVTDLEARLNTRATADTLRALQRIYPGVRFVWIMGADNLATIHKWRDWQDIFRTMPIVVVARPGYAMKALASPAAKLFAASRLDSSDAELLPFRKAPAWTYLDERLDPTSSTAIRARGLWPTGAA